MKKMFNINGFPSQKGKIAIVTGANTGLGFEVTLALAKKEMTIIMACRSLPKAEESRKKIIAQVPLADITTIEIDLGRQSSIYSFSKFFLQKYKRLDILINNAGIMMPPFSLTDDKLESQMAVNYFGHFLLTSLLMETLDKTPGARVISVSSIAHKNAKIDFENLNNEKNYSRFGSYAQSKLACLMFALELNRRLKARESATVSIAAHPGVALTELGRYIPKLFRYLFYPLITLMTQNAKQGAEPLLLASLGYPGNSKQSNGGEYFGPSGFNEWRGRAGKAMISSTARNQEVAKELWENTEKILGIKFFN